MKNYDLKHFAPRILEIKKRLNEIPIIWNSVRKQHRTPGDCIIGIFSSFNTNNRVVVITENGAVEVSLTVDLECNFNRQRIRVGDLIGIKYLGRHKGLLGVFQDEYALVTDKPKPPAPTKPYYPTDYENNSNGESA